jgi:RNA polymerase sigma-B factor
MRRGAGYFTVSKSECGVPESPSRLESALHIPPSSASRLSKRERQNALARQYHEDPDSRGYVVGELLPLAKSLASRYKRGEEPYDDLLQVASIGLLKALERFDANRGLDFAGFAIPTITGELRRHYRDTGWAVHVPRSVQEMAQKVTRAEREFFADHGRHPSLAEVAEALDTDEETVLEARIAGEGMRSSSTDEPLGGDESSSRKTTERFLQVIDAGYEAAERRATLGELTANLEPRDRMILTMRFAQGRTQREIGEAVGISQMQVSRILKTIQQKLEANAA